MPTAIHCPKIGTGTVFFRKATPTTLNVGVPVSEKEAGFRGTTIPPKRKTKILPEG